MPDGTRPRLAGPPAEEIQAFKDVWTAQLSRLFNWRDEYIAEHLQTKDWVWRNPWFLHDSPSDFLSWGLIFTETSEEIHFADEHPHHRWGSLSRAMGTNGDFYQFLKPDFDWEAAKSRVAEVVKKYGLTYSTLPQKPAS